jgi:ribonuclease P protein component
MLKKANRLTTRFEFNVVKKYGTKFWTDFFVITYVKPTNYTGPTKIGFVVANSISKNATKRNRVKRLLREAFRHTLDKIPNDLWISVSVNSKVLEKTYEEICTQVNRFIQKISIAN